MKKERPILFSGPMIRALMKGRKTQTRRIVKPQPEFRGSQDSWFWKGGPALRKATYGADYVHTDRCALERAMVAISPFQAGQLLWVKETFGFNGNQADDVVYRATANLHDPIPWTPAIFMPRKYSRITLEIVSVRVERLQEISEADAMAEGVTLLGTTRWETEGRDAYHTLWESINGNGSWEINPWIWRLEFRRV